MHTTLMCKAKSLEVDTEEPSGEQNPEYCSDPDLYQAIREHRADRSLYDDMGESILLSEADISRMTGSGQGSNTIALLLINDSMEVLQSKGTMELFLENVHPAHGQKVLDTVRREIAIDLRMAIYLARDRELPVRREGLSLGGDSDIPGSIEVIPMKACADSDKFCFLIIFSTAPGSRNHSQVSPPKRTEDAGASRDDKKKALHQMLEETKAYLQSVIEEQAETIDLLRSALKVYQKSEYPATHDEKISGQGLYEEMVRW